MTDTEPFDPAARLAELPPLPPKWSAPAYNPLNGPAEYPGLTEQTWPRAEHRQTEQPAEWAPGAEVTGASGATYVVGERIHPASWPTYADEQAGVDELTVREAKARQREDARTAALLQVCRWAANPTGQGDPLEAPGENTDGGRAITVITALQWDSITTGDGQWDTYRQHWVITDALVILHERWFCLPVDGRALIVDGLLADDDTRTRFVHYAGHEDHRPQRRVRQQLASIAREVIGL